ncbi:MAG: tetratricopeptide repeat protein [Bacteroidota bacterium]
MAKKLKTTSIPEADPLEHIADQVHRYRPVLSTAATCGLIALSGFLLFSRYQQHQNAIAHNEMYRAVYYFEQGQLVQALYGDGGCAGFIDVIKEYPRTNAANLAQFYAGVSYVNQQSYELAIEHLKRFKCKDWLVKARAWALIGDAYTEQQDYGQAARYYQRAANHYPNKTFTPVYLAKAALVYEADGKLLKALTCYQRIVKEFLEAEQYGEACKHVARISTLVQQ